MPSARSERVVAPCGSVLEHLPVRPRPFRAFRCGFAKLKAVSGDSGDEWLVEPDWHHQGRLSTAGYARRAHRAAQECMKSLLALPVRHQTPQLRSSWLCPRSPSSPAVSRAMIHFHRLRVEVRMPSARSERVVAPCGSVLERFFVQFAVVAKRFFALRDKIMNHPFYLPHHRTLAPVHGGCC